VILDNVSVAILTKVNLLAERHGLNCYDFVASTGRDDGITSLVFEIPAQGNALRVERFESMLRALNVPGDGCLKGDDVKIVDALDNAIDRAPKRRFGM
jgi:hypothetical protein